MYIYIYICAFRCIKDNLQKKQLCSLYVMCLDWAVSFQDPNKLQRLIHFAAKLHVSENINIEQASHIYNYIYTYVLIYVFHSFFVLYDFSCSVHILKPHIPHIHIYSTCCIFLIYFIYTMTT